MHPASLQLSVVIPTFNEVGNVSVLIDRLTHTLQGIEWEIIFVDDDSRDGTYQKLQTIAVGNSRVRVLRRVGRRGLSSACIEGLLASAAPYMAVMDADLQHDENCLPVMFQAVQSEGFDLAVGSRYVEGGSTGDWNPQRVSVSKWATLLSQKILKLKLQDPMSGFFMLRRVVLEDAVYRLSSLGFKILVDLVVSSPKPLRIKEIPFHFGLRVAGESKLDTRVAWDYVMLLADKTLGRYIPAKLISFASVGAMGVGVHLTVLGTGKALFALPFMYAQGSAVLVSMVFNFYLNNLLTYRDQQLQGRAWVWGLLKFMLACSLGGAANVGVANYLYGNDGLWVLSGLMGILVGLIWNFGVTSIFVWPQRAAP
jgi:dolichol-phosphate mannosyltransferase